MRVLSGIQPSGALHIGNYFGAIRQYLALQDRNDAFYFVANYHALTSVRDAAKLRGHVFDVLVDLLALGLDPERCNGYSGAEPERRLLLREDLQEWLRQSAPSFPANTLGL